MRGGYKLTPGLTFIKRAASRPAQRPSKLFGSHYPRSFAQPLPDLAIAILIISSISTMIQQASGGPALMIAVNLGGPCIPYCVRNSLSGYLCPLGRDDSPPPGMFSGALGPTIQSSIASHSLQLFSAASISAMTGP